MSPGFTARRKRARRSDPAGSFASGRGGCGPGAPYTVEQLPPPGWGAPSGATT